MQSEQKDSDGELEYISLHEAIRTLEAARLEPNDLIEKEPKF